MVFNLVVLAYLPAYLDGWRSRSRRSSSDGAVRLCRRFCWIANRRFCGSNQTCLTAYTIIRNITSSIYIIKWVLPAGRLLARFHTPALACAVPPRLQPAPPSWRRPDAPASLPSARARCQLRRSRVRLLSASHSATCTKNHTRSTHSARFQKAIAATARQFLTRSPCAPMGWSSLDQCGTVFANSKREAGFQRNNRCRNIGGQRYTCSDPFT